MYDLASEIGTVLALTIEDYTTAVAAPDAVVDMLGYEGLTFIMSHGINGAGTGSITVVLKHGDTDVVGSMTNVAAADIIGTLPTALVIDGAVSTISKFGYRGTKRYVAYTNTKTGTITSNQMCVIAIKSHPIKVA